MIECNIYTGYDSKLSYQFTEPYDSLLDAELDAQEISEMDAEEYGYDKCKCLWLAVETGEDNLSSSQLIGSNYL